MDAARRVSTSSFPWFSEKRSCLSMFCSEKGFGMPHISEGVFFLSCDTKLDALSTLIVDQNVFIAVQNISGLILINCLGFAFLVLCEFVSTFSLNWRVFNENSMTKVLLSQRDLNIQSNNSCPRTLGLLLSLI